MMKAWTKAVLCILLSFMCVFTCIGYAAVTDDLRVRTDVSLDVPLGLFITSVTTQGSSNVEENEVSFLPYTTTVDSLIDKRNYGTTSVTYKVTVLNNTKLTYSYRGIYYQTGLDDYDGNSYVSTSNGSRRIGVVCSLANASAADKKVAPGETLTFTVTYTVGSSLSTSTDWKTLINFQFGINVDGEREALEVVEDKFLNILNTPSTYIQLIDVLDNKFDGSQEWTSNYIGNVQGSSSEDSVAVNTLFAGQLQITVGDEEMDATVLIKHENLDGNTLTGDDYVATNQNNGGVFRGYGCEMTLYLTIDPLDRANAYVPVYAVVFTCDRDETGAQTSNWYRVGNTYVGTANVVKYDGGSGTGSFVTDNWRADAANYQLIEGYSFDIDGDVYEVGAYSHIVANQESIKSIVSATDANATATLEALLNDARRIINNNKYAGMGIEIIEQVYSEHYRLYTLNPDGTHTVDPELTIAQLTPAMTELYQVLNDALLKIEALSVAQQTVIE